MGNCFDCLKGVASRENKSSWQKRSSPQVSFDMSASDCEKDSPSPNQPHLLLTGKEVSAKPVDVSFGTNASSGSTRQISDEMKEDRSSRGKVVRRLFSDDAVVPKDLDDLNHPDRKVQKTKGPRVDINYANVHELKVIGLSKEQAHHVVNYRVLNGHFHHKEEVSKIPVIDHDTWSRIESKITLVPSGLGSHSRVAVEKLGGTEEVESTRARGKGTVDLNRCTFHELCVIGLSQLQAQALISYRVKYGPFTSKEEIKQVQGITNETYLLVESRLTLIPSGVFSTPERRSSNSNGRRNSPRSPFLSPITNLLHTSSTGGILPALGVDRNQSRSPSRSHQISARSHLDSSPRKPGSNFSTPQKQKMVVDANGDLSHMPPENPLEFLPPPLVQWSAPPQVKSTPRSSGARKNRGTIRIASWNLQCFNESKIRKEGVLEVVCTTIIRNGFDIVAVQEIGNKGALEKVCQELNHPSLPKVVELGVERRYWNYCISSQATGRMFQGMEYGCFLWNIRSGITFQNSFLIENQTKFREDRLFVRNPFAGSFMVGDWQFVLVSVHLIAEGWGKKHIREVEAEVGNLPLLTRFNDTICRESDIILLGDFNASPDSRYYESLRRCDYTNLIEEPTNISSLNPNGDKSYDNIWVSSRLREERYVSSNRGVVRRNLQVPGSKPGTPDSTVSDHCPIWAGFSA